MSALLSGSVLRFLSGIASDYDDRPIRFRQDLEAMIRADRLGDALALLLAQQLRVERIGGRDGTLEARSLYDSEGFRPLLGGTAKVPPAIAEPPPTEGPPAGGWE